MYHKNQMHVERAPKNNVNIPKLIYLTTCKNTENSLTTFTLPIVLKENQKPQEKHSEKKSHPPRYHTNKMHIDRGPLNRMHIPKIARTTYMHKHRPQPTTKRKTSIFFLKKIPGTNEIVGWTGRDDMIG